MKKKNITSENYLDRVPLKKESVGWSKDDKGNVTIEIENKGAFNRIAQKLFKKPEISYIHLDDNGSFVWLQIDGKTDITNIGKRVDEHFGEKAQPLYERLVKFFEILVNYGFVTWKE